MQQPADDAGDATRNAKYHQVTSALSDIITSVRSFFMREKHQQQPINVNRCVARTAECLGISTRTVMRVSKKVKEGTTFPNSDLRDRKMTVPQRCIPQVRKTIMGMYKAQEHVTLDTILTKLQAKRGGRIKHTKWKWSRTTLYNFLIKQMNYCYKSKKSYYDSVKEDLTIAEQRVKYLKQLKEYREEGRPIYYQDETWVNKNMTTLKAWIDDNDNAVGAPGMPQGKGERSIVSHVGNENGFLDGAELIYRGNKALKNSDYHSEMNAKVFQHWTKKEVFPKLPKNSVLVIDRATYHTVLTEETKPASSKFNKLELAQWIQKRKICVKIRKNLRVVHYKTLNSLMELTKVELAAICKRNKPKPKYVISEIAAKFKVKILILPVAHPELNPIELIWSQLKQHLKKKNVDYSLTKVEELAKEFFAEFDNSIWKKCVDHVKKIEEEYLEIADDLPVAI